MYEEEEKKHWKKGGEEKALNNHVEKMKFSKGNFIF
jgi:hypothetical protein